MAATVDTKCLDWGDDDVEGYEKIARRVTVLEGKVEENMEYVKKIRIISLHQRAVAGKCLRLLRY